MPNPAKLILTTAAVGLIAASPALASKRYNVDVTATAKLAGTSGLSVTMAGKPIGTCSGTAKIVSDGARFNAKCKHGRLRVKVTYSKSSQAKGTWRVLSGTGRYKNASGSGRYTGNLTRLQFHMVGTARY